MHAFLGLISSRKRLAVALALAGALAASAAYAYFTVSVASGGNGRSQSGSLNPPTAVSATASATTVAVGWTGSTTSASSPAPQGYYVTRTNTSTNATSPACGSSAASPVAATSCSDTNVPGGTYTYAATAVYYGWTATSDPSGNVTVISDTSPPTASITFPASGQAYSAGGYSAGCSTTGLCGTATDATGVQSIRISVRNSAGSYWNGTAFSGTTETFNAAALASPGSTSTTWSYPLSLPADGTYVVHVQSGDTAGNSQSGTTYAATSTFSVDTTAPTATITSPAASGFYNGSSWPGSISGAAADATGVAAVAVSIKNSAGNYWNGSAFSGTAETFSPATLTTPNGPSTNWSYGFNLPADGSYVVHVHTTDTVGNTQTSTSYAGTAAFTADSTAPSTVTAFPAGGNAYSSAGWSGSISGTASDATSGVQSVQIALQQANGSYWDPSANGGQGGFTHTGALFFTASGTTSWSYSFPFTKFPAGGSYTVYAKSTDNAGNASPPVSNTFSVGVGSLALALNTTTIATLPLANDTGSLSNFTSGEGLTFRLDNPTTGQLLTGTSTAPASGGVSVNFPAGLTTGSHTVYVTGATSGTASAPITVNAPYLPAGNAGSALLSSGSSVVGYIDGIGYTVEAQPTPASGKTISTVTANLGNLGGGSSVSVPLKSSGTLNQSTLSAGTVSYAYQSAAQPAPTVSNGQTYAYTVTATDSSNDTTTATYNATAQTTGPAAASLVTSNGGAANAIDSGDTITYGFTQGIDPVSVNNKWSGASTATTAQIKDGNAGDDTLVISANGWNVGAIDLGSKNWVTANDNCNSSTIAQNDNRTTITLTLGGCASATSVVTPAPTLTWTPSTAAANFAAKAVTAAPTATAVSSF